MSLPIDQILHGDCLDVMERFPDNSVDAIVTDPPAGIFFMNKSFDSDRGGRTAWISWLSERMSEAKRVLKPGGYALVWALPRTSHWTAMALEDAGFELKDCLTHLFSSGFPKSHNVSKAIDALAGAEREVIGPKIRLGDKKPCPHNALNDKGWGKRGGTEWRDPETVPATVEAQQWDGWGTALKPASEHWWLCRKPLGESSIAANVLTWGTGGINIDGCRVPGQEYTQEEWDAKSRARTTGNTYGVHRASSDPVPPGRWPANVVFSHSLFCTEEQCVEGCPVQVLNEQAGERKSGFLPAATVRSNRTGYAGVMPAQTGQATYGDTGPASRYYHCFHPEYPFFYAPKAGRSERNRGIAKQLSGTLFDLEGLPDGAVPLYGTMKGTDEHAAKQDTPEANIHPTVKSQPLMQFLCKLITPPQGIILDCFCGSGSTGVAAASLGFHFIGIDLSDTQEEPYVTIARQRFAYAQSHYQRRGWEAHQLVQKEA